MLNINSVFYSLQAAFFADLQAGIRDPSVWGAA